MMNKHNLVGAICLAMAVILVGLLAWNFLIFAVPATVWFIADGFIVLILAISAYHFLCGK